MTRIAAVAGDAGGAAALSPVLRALASIPSVDLRLFAYRQASSLWSHLGVPVDPLPDDSVADPRNWMGHAPVDLVLTATSVNGVNHERAAVRWATAVGVPSLSMVDFWSNYGARFRDDPQQAFELPTAIAVMDDRARQEMLAEGFPADRLVITGQPAFDDIAAFRAGWDESQRRDTRRELLGAGADLMPAVVLFASQPLTEMGVLAGQDAVPIDERDVVAALIDSLDEIADRDGRDIVLVVRPHPRQEMKRADLPNGRRIRVVLSRAARPWAAALGADVVVGMTSVLVVEAALLGCPVVSVQPAQQCTDPLPRGGDARVRRVYDMARLTPVLRDALSQSATEETGRRPEAPPRTATERTVDLIFTLLANHGDSND